MNKFKIFSIILTISLFSFIGKVLALSNTYPTIAGRTLDDNISFSELVLYLFVLIIAIGAALMFVIAVKVGLGMITGGNTAEAKKKLKSSVIGFCVLISVYLIINTINPSILNVIDVEGKCIDGFYVKTKEKVIDNNGEEKDKFSYLCVSTDNPNLPEIEEDMESTFTPCLLKMAIGYPEADYQGMPTILFNDETDNNSGCSVPNIKIGGYKSVRLLTKLGGVYLYSKEGLQIDQDTFPAPVFTKSSLENFANLRLDNKIKSFEALDVAYNPFIVDPTNENNLIMNDFYYGIAFQNPEYRGECTIFEEKFENEDVSSLIAIRSRQREKIGNKNYIYLYPIKDCGKNNNEDKDEESSKDETEIVEPVCGPETKKYFSDKPADTHVGFCKTGTLGPNGIQGSNPWTWECVIGGKSVSCTSLANSDEQKDIGYDYETEESTDLESLEKVCKIEIPEAGTKAEELEKTIKEECGKVFDKGDGEMYDIVSFKIDAPAAVVVRGSNDKCIYFDMANIERGGSCIGDLRGSDVFDTSKAKGAARPRDLIIVSKE